ncbi:MAG: hypothetical protein ACI38U_02020 [Corynebacterium sp.]|uniref:hypothetical protein n=1 Tax=Corynebacterium sp. TaxID=1720 RepID=UPI003F0F1249
MAPSSSDRKPPALSDLSVADSAKRRQHASHRTQRVRIQGLALNPPGSAEPVEVGVNDQAGWELIYKNPAIRVKCLVKSCDTLLTAKRMSKSGLRFLAVRSGGCSHNLVEMRVERGEVEQDPSELVGGGGPEGDEHLWIKGRLFKIAQSLGAEAVVEHSLTRADVFLPGHNLVLEYQRWNTDFRERTAQRSSTGAAQTVWMLPWQPSNAPRTRALRSFNNEVFEHGGIYVAVRNKDKRSELQRPWEDASQERTARLYAGGSIAVFDPRNGALVRRELSLATVLAEIMSGERILAHALVLTKGNALRARKRVWVLREDLARAEAAREERRRAMSKVPVAEQQSDPTPERELQPDSDAAAGQHHPPPPLDVQTSARSAELDPRPPATETSSAEGPAPEEAIRKAADVDTTNRTAEALNNQRPATRGSWRKSIVGWFRRM